MEFKVKECGKEGVLNLKGDLTIARSNELRTILTNSLNSVERIILNLEDVTDVDVSCLQLIYSAYLTANNSNKHIKVNRCSSAFTNVMKITGFHNKDCFLECGNKCF